ncbi:FtsX-like permease family protein [Spirillospora sp. NPDC052269]
MMTLLPVAAATLRRRRTAMAGSFVALALGVALIAAVGQLVTRVPDPVDPQAPSPAKLLQFMAGLTGLVAVFVVAGTFAFAVAQRRGETARLRAAGATPGQIRALILAESLLVGLAAAVAGAVLSPVPALLLASWLVSEKLAPAGFEPGFGAGPPLLAAVAGLAVALLGSFAAARRAGRVRPAEALAEAAVDGRVMTAGRWAWSLVYLLAAGGYAVSYLSMPAYQLRAPGMRGPDSKATWSLELDTMLIIGLALFAPLLVPPLVRAIALPLPLLRGSAGLLAGRSARASARRTISTATPVFLVVALTGSVVGAGLAFARARDLEARNIAAAPYVAAPANGAVLPPQTLQALRPRPGLVVATTASAMVTGLGVEPLSTDENAANPPVPYRALVVDGDLTAAWRLRVTSGTTADLRGATVAVSSELARAYGWKVGDRLNTRLPDGTPAALRLVATVRPTFELPEVILPGSALHRTVPPARAYLSERPAGPVPGAVVSRAGDGHDADAAAAAHFQRLTILAILGPALLYALIAVVNTLIMSTRDRLRDVAALNAVGATRRQVSRAVATETLLTVMTAALLALAVTAVTQAVTVRTINGSVLTGNARIPYDLPWTALGLSTLACLALAVASALLSLRPILRGTFPNATPRT